MTTHATIAEAAADAFGLGTVAGEPVAVDEAWSNQVLRVVTSSGRYAVKVFTGVSRAALETGRTVEALVAATGEIPMPTPVAAADGSWFVKIETHLLRCHRWVEEVRQARLPMWLSHDDLDPKNAVARPDSSVAITDWDYTGPCWPTSSSSWPRPRSPGAGSAKQDLVRAFVHAYGDAGGNAALEPTSVEEAATSQRAVHDLLASFADDVAHLRHWATRISAM